MTTSNNTPSMIPPIIPDMQPAAQPSTGSDTRPGPKAAKTPGVTSGPAGKPLTPGSSGDAFEAFVVIPGFRSGGGFTKRSGNLPSLTAAKAWVREQIARYPDVENFEILGSDGTILPNSPE